MSDINTIAADQARADREAAEARGDMDAAREADALEREFLGGDVTGDDDDEDDPSVSAGLPDTSLDDYQPYDALTGF